MRRSCRTFETPDEPHRYHRALLGARQRALSMEAPMSTVRNLLVAPLVLLTLSSAPAFADQRHAVDSTQLAATVSEHIAQQDADRSALREALTRPEVQAVAAKLGVDLTRATAAVETLSGDDLSRAADAARRLNQQFVGGASSVVISTTTIIIALLVLILIIVAVK